VPVLALDPKGDLANLALALDPSRPDEFVPWVDPGEAARQGLSVEALAAATAAAWAEAWRRDGLGPDALAHRRRAVEVVVHTPGSESGVPIDVFTALTRPPEGLDPEGLRAYVTGAVQALLALVGQAADPLTDPRAILLARVLGDAFARGEPAVRRPAAAAGRPAVRHARVLLGRRRAAARGAHRAGGALNNVAASPAFQAWLTGVPLDVGAWLARRPRARRRSACCRWPTSTTASARSS
jgi:hypothetical protein